MFIYNKPLHIGLLLVFIIISSAFAEAKTYNKPNSTQPDQLAFRENKGQWDSHILYKLDLKSTQIYAEQGRFTWAVHNIEDLKNRAEFLHRPERDFSENIKDMPIIRSHAFRMNFLNSNPHHGYLAQDSSSSYSNYFIGNKSEKWASKVYDFKTIQYTELYPGIDLKFYNQNSYLKYEFIVEAGADPSTIKVEYEGVDELHIVAGNLFIVTSVAEIKELRPYAYQIIDGREMKVDCEFRLKDNVLSYYLPKGYNKAHQLIIDPTLIFASYSGSRSDNWGMTATPGPNGELYGGGVVFGAEYPTTTGAYNSKYSSQPSFIYNISDIGFTKFSPDGTEVLYATYLGGRASDIPHSMIVNNKGELVIYGTSSSSNYPTTDNAYNRNHQGGLGGRDVNGIRVVGADIVVSILSEDGSELVGSTFIGGSGEDGALYNQSDLVRNYSDQLRGEVIVDKEDNIYVASSSNSPDFPLKSAFQQQINGNFDAVVFSLSSDVSDLRWSSYLGGEQDDAAYSITIDHEGNILVGGGTTSESLFNFPDVINPNYSGDIDGFLAKISQDGNQLIKGTYIGTDRYDQVYFTEIDQDNNIFIYGQSRGNMPVSEDVYSNDGGGMFIQKIAPDLSEYLMATRIGSGNNITNISPSAFLIDQCNRIYISGWGGVTNRGFNNQSTTRGLPTTPDALQPTTDGSDFYFMVLEENATDLLYASFFGADLGNSPSGQEHVDGGTSRFSKDGIIYQAVCAGCLRTNAFPTTPDAAYPDMLSNNCNLGVFKMAFNLDEIHARAEVLPDTIACYPFTITLRNQSQGTSHFLWDFGDGTTSTEYEPTHTFNEPGIYNIQLIALSKNICIAPDTAYLELIIKEHPEDSIIAMRLCSDSTLTLSARVNHPDAIYQWNTGDTEQSIQVEKTGNYIVITELQNCTYRDSFFINFATPDTRIKNTIVCDEADLTLIVDDKAENIWWNTGTSDQAINVTEAGEYIVTYSIDGCPFSDTASVTFPTPPRISIKGDATACAGEEITLTVEEINEAMGVDFYWDTGDRNNSIQVHETGTYAVKATSEEGCEDTDSIYVYFIPIKPLPDIPDSTIRICNDSEYIIDLSAYEDKETSIVWSDGSRDYERSLPHSGNFSFTIENKCQTINDEISFVKSRHKSNAFPTYIPNAFTPNRDGINDGFRPLFDPEVSILEYKFEVFDRWGNRLVQYNDPDLDWVGNYKEKEMEPGIYFWTLDVNYFICEKPAQKLTKGTVSILK